MLGLLIFINLVRFSHLYSCKVSGIMVIFSINFIKIIQVRSNIPNVKMSDLIALKSVIGIHWIFPLESDFSPIFAYQGTLKIYVYVL